MKIALVAHQLPPRHLGGVEVYTWTLAQSLLALGHAVAIFCPTDDPQEAGQRIVEGLVLVRPWRRNPRQQVAPLAFWRNFRHRPTERAFQRFVAAWQPEIIHFQHLQWVSAQLLRQDVGVPKVLTLHDYWFICPNSQLVRPDGQSCQPTSTKNCAACLLAGRGAAPKLLPAMAFLARPAIQWRNRYVRKAAMQADWLLTPSAAARNVYLQAGFPSERFRAFDNGLDPSRFTALPAPRGRREYTVFGYLGGIAWQKGVHVLLEAFATLPPQHELRIYGPLDAFPNYVHQLEQLTHGHPGIRLLGPVAPEQVGAALAELDYLVVPSLWPETFGMVAQEAHHVGVPVIASRIGALTRLEDGIDGLLFTAGDTVELGELLQRVVAQPDLRAQLAAQIAPGPTISEQARLLVTLYQRLIAERASR